LPFNILHINPYGSIICGHKLVFSIFYERAGGRGYTSDRWYSPGGYLTEQTGSRPDTVQRSRRHVEGWHAMESEQCDGRDGKQEKVSAMCPA
jgi:hypothetical protein